MTNPTRRTLVRGAAWTVPVVAIAATASAYAASSFACHVTTCKTRNKKDTNRWDFKARLNCSDGQPLTVAFNGQPATLRWVDGAQLWVLEKQPHNWSARVTVTDTNGVIGFDSTVQFGSCGSASS